ncbi:c-type cytochrome [Azospirillum soli]|uniref:c-type cytochrome n=1 Tax=Azospirillum soli TaxID=1304799 RepID=UPI001AEA6FCD|nr:cytochrome c [Azospirillum soli]MBP2312709.1 mono/diheme cytochrome c family protein [Azospirillum soli]
MKRPPHPVMALGAAALAALLTSAASAQPADPVAGRRLANRWCTSCHVVDSGKGGTDAVPTLASIARDPNRGPNWVRQWLTSPHPPMPDLNLSRNEIEDVVAYLQSLAR